MRLPFQQPIHGAVQIVTLDLLQTQELTQAALLSKKNSQAQRTFVDKPPMNERRSETRFPDKEPLVISWQDFRGTARQSGMLQNLSSLGMGVLLDHSIPVGTQVTITYDRVQTITGVVKHLVRRTYDCLIGVEFCFPNWGVAAQHLQFQAQMPVPMEEIHNSFYGAGNAANFGARTVKVNEPQMAV